MEQLPALPTCPIWPPCPADGRGQQFESVRAYHCFLWFTGEWAQDFNPQISLQCHCILSARWALVQIECWTRFTENTIAESGRAGVGQKSARTGNRTSAVYYATFSGNKPGIQRDARVAGNARRSGARGLSDARTSLSSRADTMRRACRSLVPSTASASPRGSSPR